MIRALLLDLDDTLLRNDTDTFLGKYFAALTGATSHLVEPGVFTDALNHGVREMLASQDAASSNKAVFWRAFLSRLEVDEAEIIPVVDGFYEKIFPGLSGSTQKIEGAAELVRAARGAGLRLALATNPIFPLRAIEHRVEWAGLRPSDFDLITAYENTHFTKPHAAYFAGVVELLGFEPGDCVMAGNHLEEDLLGARRAGLRTFFVDTFPLGSAEVEVDARGSLGDLRLWLELP